MNDDQELSNAASRSALETGETWIAAEQNGDTAALGTLLADNFVGVGPAGYLLTKDQWIGRFKGGLHNDRITWEDVRVRVRRHRDAACFGDSDHDKVPGRR